MYTSSKKSLNVCIDSLMVLQSHLNKFFGRKLRVFKILLKMAVCIKCKLLTKNTVLENTKVVKICTEKSVNALVRTVHEILPSCTYILQCRARFLFAFCPPCIASLAQNGWETAGSAPAVLSRHMVT